MNKGIFATPLRLTGFSTFFQKAMPDISPCSGHIFTHDHHIHTSLCNHAQGEMEEYVQAAIARNLTGITFLEHMEQGIVWDRKIWLNENDFDLYFEEGMRLQKLYSSQLIIKLGVECGYNPEESKTILERLNNSKWDEIGISCHFLKRNDRKSHLNIFSRNKSDIAYIKSTACSSLWSQYFEHLQEAVRILPGTFLTHLDGAFRHIPELKLESSHFRQIETLLHLVKEKGMALEINTSGLRIRNEQFPSTRILAMAREMNIPLQLGSDAHKPGDVGAGFAECRNVLYPLNI